MTTIQIIFYLFSAIAIASGVMVVTARHPVRSVLSLVVTFFAMSGVWMLLRAEFLSLILLLVYVGAVMTLFLFVVMMLAVNQEAKQAGWVRYFPFSLIIILLLVGILIVMVGPSYLGIPSLPAASTPTNDNLHRLGLLLFTEYLYPFELAGVLLLAAIIAAITLTHRGPVKRKVQAPSDQVAAKREDYVRLVKMGNNQ